jgi:hypothetical protein
MSLFLKDRVSGCSAFVLWSKTLFWIQGTEFKTVLRNGNTQASNTLKVQLAFSIVLHIKIFQVCLRITNTFTSGLMSGSNGYGHKGNNQ